MLNEVNQFLVKIFYNLKQHNLEVSQLYLDHVAFQASASLDYDNRKQEIMTFADEYSQEIIGGRRVGVFRLHKPITYEDRTIPVIELIEPKPEQVCPSAWEHAEFVIAESFDEFIKKYPQLSWDTSSAYRPDFPHLKLKLSEHTQVKFHHNTIIETIDLERKAKTQSA